MKTKTTTYLISSLIVVLVGTFILKANLNTKNAQMANSFVPLKVDEKKPEVYKNGFNSVATNSENQPAASGTEKPSQTEVSIMNLISEQDKKMIHSYRLVKEKPFQHDQEKEFVRKTLLDDELIKKNSFLLSVKASSYEEQEIQNEYIDLVLDSALAGNTDSLNVVKKFIEDPTIETDQLPQAEKNNLAEIKAEVLYHIASGSITSEQEIENLIPGPITKKIWENVKKSHTANLVESESEIL